MSEEQNTNNESVSWHVGFINAIGTILFSPSKFFAAMPTSGKVGHSLTLGLMIHWIGMIAQFFWSETFGQNIEQLLRQFNSMTGGGDTNSLWIDRLKDPNIVLFLKLGPVLADPISTLVKILVSACVIYFAIRLLVDAGKDGAPDEHRLETVVKIYGYAQIPYVLYLVPIAGGFLAPIWSFVTLVKGIKTVYRTSMMRTILIVLFPVLFVASLMIIAFFASLLLGFKVITGLLTGF